MKLYDDPAVLVLRAASGDQLAWDRLVARYSARLWAVCRAHRLSAADAADVFQQTWLRAVENLDSLRDPARFGAWLGTTCRYEALAALRRARRVHVTDRSWWLEQAGEEGDDPALPVLTAARDAELWAAFQQLSRRCQDVLRVLVVDAEDGRPSYELAAAALDMPIGSLGPTRQRCLEHLRKFLTAEC